MPMKCFSVESHLVWVAARLKLAQQRQLPKD